MEKDVRQRLLDTATELFSRHGFTAVSIRKLSAAAGANSALISYYFGGKDGLYAAVLEQAFAPFTTIKEQVLATEGSPVEQILAYGRFVSALHQENPHLVRFFYSELMAPTAAFDAMLHKYLQTAFQFLSAALRQGIQSGHFRPDIDIEYSTLALAGMLNFFYLSRPINRQLLPDRPEPGPRYIENALKIYLQGVQRHGHQ